MKNTHYLKYSFFVVLAISSYGCAGFVANKAFSSIDRNNDGKITFDEYPREDYTGTKRSTADSKRAFIKTDKNKDGVITPNELFDGMLDHQ